jgi:hypothetical protein
VLAASAAAGLPAGSMNGFGAEGSNVSCCGCCAMRLVLAASNAASSASLASSTAVQSSGFGTEPQPGRSSDTKEALVCMRGCSRTSRNSGAQVHFQFYCFALWIKCHKAAAGLETEAINILANQNIHHSRQSAGSESFLTQKNCKAGCELRGWVNQVACIGVLTT